MKYAFNYTHQGYIAEDHDHVSFSGKGVVFATNLDEAIRKAVERRNEGEECSQAWIDENCEVTKNKKKTSAEVVWSWSDADGNGETEMVVKVKK